MRSPVWTILKKIRIPPWSISWTNRKVRHRKRLPLIRKTHRIVQGSRKGNNSARQVRGRAGIAGAGVAVADRAVVVARRLDAAC